MDSKDYSISNKFEISSSIPEASQNNPGNAEKSEAITKLFVESHKYITSSSSVLSAKKEDFETNEAENVEDINIDDLDINSLSDDEKQLLMAYLNSKNEEVTALFDVEEAKLEEKEAKVEEKEAKATEIEEFSIKATAETEKRNAKIEELQTNKEIILSKSDQEEGKTVHHNIANKIDTYNRVTNAAIIEMKAALTNKNYIFLDFSSKQLRKPDQIDNLAFIDGTAKQFICRIEGGKAYLPKHLHESYKKQPENFPKELQECIILEMSESEYLEVALKIDRIKSEIILQHLKNEQINKETTANSSFKNPDKSIFAIHTVQYYSQEKVPKKFELPVFLLEILRDEESTRSRHAREKQEIFDEKQNSILRSEIKKDEIRSEIKKDEINKEMMER